MAYTDLTFVQNYTQTTYGPTTTPTDTFVNELIADAEAEVDEFTGRQWESTQVTERIYAPKNCEYLLKLYPVISIDTVVSNSGADVAFEDRQNGFIKITGTGSYEYVDVTYTYGYATVPTHIKMLTTLYTVRKIVQGNSSGNSNTQSLSVGPISITSAVGLTAVYNLDTDIKTYEKRVRRLMR